MLHIIQTKEFYDWEEFCYNSNLNVIKCTIYLSFPQMECKFHEGRPSYSLSNPSTLGVQEINMDTQI